MSIGVHTSAYGQPASSPASGYHSQAHPCTAIRASGEIAAPVLGADHVLGREFHQDEPDCRTAG